MKVIYHCRCGNIFSYHGASCNCIVTHEYVDTCYKCKENKE